MAITYNRTSPYANTDIYGFFLDVANSSLWWVFAIRNPNVIQDPIYDFQPGVIIYVPQKQNLTTALGL